MSCPGLTGDYKEQPLQADGRRNSRGFGKSLLCVSQIQRRDQKAAPLSTTSWILLNSWYYAILTYYKLAVLARETQAAMCNRDQLALLLDGDLSRYEGTA